MIWGDIRCLFTTIRFGHDDPVWVEVGARFPKAAVDFKAAFGGGF